MTILRHRRESEARSLPAPAGVHTRTGSMSSASSSSPPVSPPPTTSAVTSPIASPAMPTSLPPIPSDPHKKRHLRVPHLGRSTSSEEKQKKEAGKKHSSAPSTSGPANKAASQSPQLRAPVLPFAIPRETELVHQYNREGCVVPSTAELYQYDTTVQTLAYGTPRPVLASEIFRCPSYTTAVPKNRRGLHRA